MSRVRNFIAAALVASGVLQGLWGNCADCVTCSAAHPGVRVVQCITKEWQDPVRRNVGGKYSSSACLRQFVGGPKLFAQGWTHNFYSYPRYHKTLQNLRRGFGHESIRILQAAKECGDCARPICSKIGPSPAEVGHVGAPVSGGIRKEVQQHRNCVAPNVPQCMAGESANQHVGTDHHGGQLWNGSFCLWPKYQKRVGYPAHAVIPPLLEPHEVADVKPVSKCCLPAGLSVLERFQKVGHRVGADVPDGFPVFFRKYTHWTYHIAEIGAKPVAQAPAAVVWLPLPGSYSCNYS